MGIAVRRPRSLAAVILVLWMAAPTAAQSPVTPQIRIDNFARVNASYFRGAQPQGQDYADLAALGIKTIINLTSDEALDGEQAAVEQNGMRYLRIPMTTRKAPTAAQLDTFLAVVNDPASQPVYVHCVGGRHRTGVMTAVYRMTRDGLSGADAFREMKQFKYGPDFLHPEFKTFVQSFDPKTRTAAANAGSQ
jgi:tyrosine-protein phosphatase SIW14